MLSKIYKHPFHHAAGEEAVKERRDICNSKRIAITDTIYRCRRIKPLSSKDSDLEVVEKRDILKILSERPSLGIIILTDSSGPSSASKVFLQHLSERGIPVNYKSTIVPVSGNFNLGKRTISFYSLYSTSGINIGRYAAAKRQYQECLPE